MTPTRPLCMSTLVVLATALTTALATAACDDNCIDRCPAPRALATCAASGATTTVDALLADPTPSLGAVVAVRGALGEEPAMCTQLGCFDGCCNSCGARLGVNGAAGALLPITSTTADLVCDGDEAKICCPLALGRDVVVQGTFLKESDTLDGPTFVVTDALPCAPP